MCHMQAKQLMPKAQGAYRIKEKERGDIGADTEGPGDSWESSKTLEVYVQHEIGFDFPSVRFLVRCKPTLYQVVYVHDFHEKTSLSICM
jgi:hypothetical protein